jgi:hypothetical protein
VSGSLRRLALKINWWLGLAGNINLVYTIIVGGAAATVLTTVAVYTVSFLDFVSAIPLFFRVLFYASVFTLSFALFNHARQRLPGWWARRGGTANASPETETRERQRARDAPISLRPEPQPASSDRPFSLEPVKRRGSPKPNGEFDIYMSIRVANKGSGWIRGCRGRLVRVQDLFSTPDGSEWRGIPHIHPAYLRWSPGDGGSDSADFTTEAILDVAVIESWEKPVYQLLTANESLRSTYQLEYGQVGPILSIEISAQSGGRMEQTFSLDGHLRGFLEAPTEVEPQVRWPTWPS